MSLLLLQNISTYLAYLFINTGEYYNKLRLHFVISALFVNFWVRKFLISFVGFDCDAPQTKASKTNIFAFS